MGIFGTSVGPFDQIVEKVTDEKNTNEDWGIIMSVCDRVGATKDGPKECLKSVVKRLNHQDPHVVMQAITLLDACVNNCGKQFLLEVASREFENEFKKLLSKSHPKIAGKLREMLKRWAEGEFSKDAQYGLIPSLYNQLKKEGMDFSNGSETTTKKTELPKDPNVVSSQQEEDDIAKAIQMSLQENQSSSKSSGKSNESSGGGLYPTTDNFGASSTVVPEVKKEERKARALYDFEAAEDNELTFKTGEVVMVLDDSDPNWWKGSNHRGEGLFPANFVTIDLETNGERRKSVVFNEEVTVQEVEQVTFPTQKTIDEAKIDQVLSMLHDADPTTGEADPADLAQLEEQVGTMGPLIDAELERVDRRHAQLTRLSHELVDALSLYHTLMQEVPQGMAGGPRYMYPGYGPNIAPGPAQHNMMGYMGGPPVSGAPPQHVMVGQHGPPMSMVGQQGPPMGMVGQQGPPMGMVGQQGNPISMVGQPGPPMGMVGQPGNPNEQGHPNPMLGQQGAPQSVPMMTQSNMNPNMAPIMHSYPGMIYSQQTQATHPQMMPGSAPPPTPPIQQNTAVNM